MAAVQDAAGKVIAFDMEAVARESGSVISSVLLGGIALADVLPFSESAYEQAIERGGKGVEASLRAFRNSLQAAERPIGESEEPAPVVADDPRLARLPASVAEVAAHALPRLLDYQDEDYVHEYLELLEPLAARDEALGREVARGLALWMTFEDTIRVADLKTAPERISPYVEAEEVMHVAEFMKPRLEEIAGSLPVSLGRWVQRSKLVAWLLTPFTGGLRIRTSSVWGYVLLRALASLKRFRRKTLRFAEERAQMQEWLGLVDRLADRDLPLAVAVAESQQLVCGYGDTHAHGLAQYQSIARRAEALDRTETGAAQVRAWTSAALRAGVGS